MLRTSVEALKTRASYAASHLPERLPQRAQSQQQPVRWVSLSFLCMPCILCHFTSYTEPSFSNIYCMSKWWWAPGFCKFRNDTWIKATNSYLVVTCQSFSFLLWQQFCTTCDMVCNTNTWLSSAYMFQWDSTSLTAGRYELQPAWTHPDSSTESQE